MNHTAEHAKNSSTEDSIRQEGEQPAIGFFDYLAFLPFFVTFLATLVCNELRFRLATSQEDKERCAQSFNRQVRACLSLVGTKIHIEQQHPPAPMDRPWLIVSNHQSLFDVSVLHTMFAAQRPKFIAKQELGRGIPGVSICLREEGSALIDRSDARQAIREIGALGKRMEEETFGVILFPEGTRARRGAMKAFKPRGLATILKHCPNAVIIPVALDGSWKLATRKLGPIPFGITMSFKVGQTLDPKGWERDEVIAETEARIQQLLRELRS